MELEDNGRYMLYLLGCRLCLDSFAQGLEKPLFQQNETKMRGLKLTLPPTPIQNIKEDQLQNVMLSEVQKQRTHQEK